MPGWFLWDLSLFIEEFTLLIPTADGHVVGLGGCGQKPITSE